jgi:kexin
MFLIFRDESPIGTWTIRVNDQGREGHSGKFLGWSMTMWGSVIDPTKAKKYEVPLVDGTLPPLFPVEDQPPATATSEAVVSTKTLMKPTAHLPTDHADAPGETHKPAFPGSNSTTTKPVEDEASGGTEQSGSATTTPTADEGWFSDLSNLMTNQVWFFVALGAVVIFGAAAGLFFWRRSVRRRQNYTSLPADEVAMRSVGSGGGRTSARSKELYAAFNEEDDDEDADEETGLRRVPDQSPVGLGYHSGFLEDDDPASAPPTRYKDEPSPAERAAERPHSPGGANSDNGSWEHASQDNAPRS